jgi:hypothetical protein
MKQLTEANQKLPPLPDGLRYAETLDEEAGFRTSRGVVPRRWANDPGVIEIILMTAIKPWR